MALVKGTNSYVTVAEADSYFADRLDVDAWNTADSATKAQALVTASAVLEEQPWAGVVVDVDQPMAFPRIGTYFDPRLGCRTVFTDSVPFRVLEACYDLAYNLILNDGVSDSTGGVKNLQVGSIKLEFILNPSVVPVSVRRKIKPILINSGANSWWRAN